MQCGAVKKDWIKCRVGTVGLLVRCAVEVVKGMALHGLWLAMDSHSTHTYHARRTSLISRTTTQMLAFVQAAACICH